MGNFLYIDYFLSFHLWILLLRIIKSHIFAHLIKYSYLISIFQLPICHRIKHSHIHEKLLNHHMKFLMKTLDHIVKMYFQALKFFDYIFLVKILNFILPCSV